MQNPFADLSGSKIRPAVVISVPHISDDIFVVPLTSKTAPYIHNLQRLAELSNIQLSDEQRDALIKITSFNLESRYPDEKRNFRKKCTEEFTIKEIEKTEEIFKWLKSILP